MDMTPGKLLPFIEVRLYDPGQGDPQVLKQSYAFTEVFGHSRDVGATFEHFSDGTRKAEVLQEVGLCCAPRVVAQDTRLAHYSVSGGVWNELLPNVGSPRKYRLGQLSSTPGVAWYAESISALPANPSIAVSLLIPASPPDWDDAAYPPYVDIRVGSASAPGSAWTIRLLKGRAHLLQWADGGWVEYMSLPAPAFGGYNDLQEMLVFIRCVGGRLLISTDGGASYSNAGTADAPVSVSSGPVRIAGQGGMCVFGVHQLLYEQSDYTSAARDTLDVRVGHVPVVAGVAYDADGGSVSYHDEGDAQYARYRVRLTPASSTWLGPGWSVYHTPVVRSVTYVIPPIVTLASESYTTPWTDRVVGLEIVKPRDLAESELRLRIKILPGSTWEGGYRRRKVRVILGWKEVTPDTTETWTAFTGYIRSVTLERTRYGTGYAEVLVDNVSAKLRKQRWSDLQAHSLSGLTVNQASDLVLTHFGVPNNLSYREWHAWGDLVQVPAGAGQEPVETVRAGESPWETLERLQSYAGLELGVTDDGVLKSLPPTWSTGVLHEVAAAGGTDLRLLAQSVSVSTDYDETGTAVLVAGRDGDGQRMWAWAVDAEAETQPLSDRFCPWRELEYDEVPGVSHPQLLTGRAQQLAQETFGLVTLVDTNLHLSDLVARRDTVRLSGFGAEGVPDGTLLSVIAVTQSVAIADSGAVSMEQRVGLKQV